MPISRVVRSLKLLTVNIHKGVTPWWRRSIMSGLRDAVAEVGADVVCLQEVRGEAAGSVPQYEALADGLWPEFAYGRNVVGRAGDHGNAILSRWPIATTFNHDVSVAGGEPRGLLHCTLDVPGLRQGLQVICVHLGLRESHRRHQTQRLLTLVNEVPPAVPVIAAGDFNDWRCRDRARLGPAGLTEVHVSHHGRPARSFPARWPLLALDRVYVRGVAAVRPMPMPRRPWRDLSDHVPVGATVTLHPSPA